MNMLVKTDFNDKTVSKCAVKYLVEQKSIATASILCCALARMIDSKQSKIRPKITTAKIIKRPTSHLMYDMLVTAVFVNRTID